ncbi:hypothetical protein GE061_012482 [Apolygus lucorum]|uniref:NADH dehydrogenase [ubiquinone] iron-sulfur protein 4, mitochondrial n=1 Tax=Apolygus lucorum TaxID=248454 RepID=A0A8S9XWI0_APOLU|nr:hypothetical protein GE061_012482 [Apolygus lucorum]
MDIALHVSGKVTQAMLKIGILTGMRCPLIFSRRAGSTGDLMKDCGWDRLLKNAYCLKEADRKDNKVEMRKAKEPQTGLAGQKISVDTHCEIKCLQYIDGTPRRAVEETHAVIRRRPKLVTQQGTNNVGVWELTLDVKERWENPCMGWSSNGYPLSNLNLYFRSSEEASVFARKRGWSFEVEDSDSPEKPKRHKAKSYAEIFSWNSRKRMSTK